MKKTIELIKSLISPFLMVLAIVVAYPPTLACDDEATPSQKAVPEIQRHKIKGIAEFAAMDSELCKQYPAERTAYIFDLHGVQSRHSFPSGPVVPRGNMPDYTRYKISRGHPAILASAWDDDHRVIEDIKSLGLQEAFKLNGEVKYGMGQFCESSCQYYKLGNVAALRRLNPTLKLPLYYFQKAFTPLLIYGSECSFDMLIFIDDSGTNIDTFLEDVVQASYFSKLKKLILFEVPTISGANLETDWIAPALLPQEFRTLIYRPKGYVNPLAQAGYYLTDHGEEEKPVVTLADPPSWFTRPSQSVIAQGEPDLADVGEKYKKSTRMMAERAPSIRVSSSNPLRQSGFHSFDDFDENEKTSESSNTPAPKRHPLAQAGFYFFGDDSDEEHESSAPSSILDAPEPVAVPTVPSSTPVLASMPVARTPDLPVPRMLGESSSLNESLAAGSGSSHGGLLLTRSAERCHEGAFNSQVKATPSNSLTKSH